MASGQAVVRLRKSESPEDCILFQTDSKYNFTKQIQPSEDTS